MRILTWTERISQMIIKMNGFVDFNAGLDEDDEDEMEHEAVQDELTGEEYELYLPNE